MGLVYLAGRSGRVAPAEDRGGDADHPEGGHRDPCVRDLSEVEAGQKVMGGSMLAEAMTWPDVAGMAVAIGGFCLGLYIILRVACDLD